MQVAEYASGHQDPSSRRNGRPSSGDTFALKHLAGGQTRWREQAVLDTTQGVVPPTVPRTQLSWIASRSSSKTNIRKCGVTKDTLISNSIATGVGLVSATRRRVSQPLVLLPSFDSQPRSVHVGSTLEPH